MIIGITIPSLIALFGGLLTYGYINDVKNRHRFVEIADDLREHVLESRRNEKNFLHYKNEEQLKKFKDAITVLINSINSISAEILEKMGEESFIQVSKSIEAYSGPIDALFKSYQHENDIIENVRAEGRKLEAFAAKGDHAKEISASFVLHLRLLEKNYMLFRDKKSFLKMDNVLSQLKNMTPLCYECIPYIKAVRNLSISYDKSHSFVNELQINGDNLEKITTRIAGTERQHINSFFTFTQMVVLSTLILLCTLGPLFVYKTSAYIVAPIKRLSEITNKISEGDTSIRAPLREHDETYSLALSFNKMLDTLQYTQASLEKTVGILHEKQMEIEKRASLGFLISGVTHELNNPLNNISLTAETIKEDLDELTREELEEFTQDILTQSERAKHIINDLLDFSGARKTTVMDKIDIVNAVEESLSLVANELKVSNIKLIIDVPDKAYFIKGNRGKLQEVFVNIIVNALHAMNGNGMLSVSAKPDIDENKMMIKISDSGPGITREHIKNIFEPFFTTKDVGEGTGLGLSVSQGIINDHNGNIDVESEEGKGTSFIIRVPLFEEEDA
jgi:signal transduction histidine kinase